MTLLARPPDFAPAATARERLRILVRYVALVLVLGAEFWLSGRSPGVVVVALVGLGLVRFILVLVLHAVARLSWLAFLRPWTARVNRPADAADRLLAEGPTQLKPLESIVSHLLLFAFPGFGLPVLAYTGKSELWRPDSTFLPDLPFALLLCATSVVLDFALGGVRYDRGMTLDGNLTRVMMPQLVVMFLALMATPLLFNIFGTGSDVRTGAATLATILGLSLLMDLLVARFRRRNP